MSIEVEINGSKDSLPKELSVAELLSIKKVESPEMVSVELNGEFVDRGAFADSIVKSGDSVEFLYFMGGGAK